MQSTLLGIAIAMIAALVAALVAPSFIDWGRYRTTFEAEAGRMIGQPVRIGGAIDVRLLPTPSLSVRQLEVGPAGAPGFSAEAAAFDLSLGALMRGQLRAVSAQLDGPKLTLALDAGGKVIGAGSLPGLEAEQVAVDRLDVANGRVTFTDAASGGLLVIDRLSFVGEMRGLGGAIKGQGGFNIDNKPFSYRLAASRGDEHVTKLRLGIDAGERPLTFESDINLSFEAGAPRYDGTVTLARIAGMALTGGKTVASDPWRISGRVKGDSKAALIEQIDARYGPEERAVKLAGTADISFGAKPRLDAVLSARQIDLDRALAAADAAGRAPAAVLRGLGESFALWLPPIPASIGVGIETVTLGGATLQTVRGDFSAAAGAWSVDSLEFRAPGGTQVKLSGRLDGGPAALQFSGPVAIESVNPQALANWAQGGVDGARSVIGPLRLRGDLTVGPEQMVLDRIVADYDRKAFEGRVAYVLAAGGRPARLDAALNAAEFDLDATQALLTSALSGRQFDWPGEVALAVKLERATFAGQEAKSVQADLRWDAAGLRIERAAVADFGGVALAASGQIDTLSVPPRGTVNVFIDAQKLDGVAALIGRFSPAAADRLRRSAARLAPAKVEAAVRVDAPPAGTAGVKSVGKLTVAGALGGVRIAVSGDAGGALDAWSDGYIRLEGRLSSADATLLSVLGLERLGAPSRPANLTVTAVGPAAGDLRIDARLAGGGLDATAAGTLRLNGEVKGSADLILNTSNLQAVRSDGQTLPVAIKSRASLAGGVLQLADIQGTAAGTPVRGEIKLGFDPPRLEGKVAADQLDLPAAFAALIGMPPRADAKSTAWPAAPFAAGLLAGLDGRIDFDAAQAAVTPSVVARNIHGVVKLKPTEITIDNVAGSIGDGSLAGWARFSKVGPGLSASGRIALSNANAAALFQASSQSPLTGRLSSQIEIEGEGSSPAALIGALRGKGALTLEGVQISGADPKAFDVAARAAERGMPITPARIGDIVDRVMEGGALTLAWASAPIEIAAGRARLGKLVRPPPADDLALSGSVDLVERTLDARVIMFGPAAGASLRPEITVAFKGPIGTPQRSVDVTALVGWLTLQSVDRASKRLEAAEQQAKSADNASSLARDEPTRSTSSISTGLPSPQSAPPLPPAIDVMPAAMPRSPPPALPPR